MNDCNATLTTCTMTDQTERRTSGMTVHVHLLHQSRPVVRENVRSTYTKDGLFCVMMTDGTVEKYPVLHLFRVVEHAEDQPLDGNQGAADE